jgi:hypothetical protein
MAIAWGFGVERLPPATHRTFPPEIDSPEDDQDYGIVGTSPEKSVGRTAVEGQAG